MSNPVLILNYKYKLECQMLKQGKVVLTSQHEEGLSSVTQVFLKKAVEFSSTFTKFSYLYLIVTVLSWWSLI